MYTWSFGGLLTVLLSCIWSGEEKSLQNSPVNKVCVSLMQTKRRTNRMFHEPKQRERTECFINPDKQNNWAMHVGLVFM